MSLPTEHLSLLLRVVDEHDGRRLLGAGRDDDGLPGPEALDAGGVDLELVAAPAPILDPVIGLGMTASPTRAGSRYAATPTSNLRRAALAGVVYVGGASVQRRARGGVHRLAAETFSLEVLSQERAHLPK